MSFFDNPKNASMALMILAVIELIGAIVSVAVSVNPFELGNLLIGIGAVICAVLYFMFAKRVATMAKIDILANFIILFGLVSIIGGVFTVVASIGSAIVGIIIGVIVILIGKRINDGQVDTFDKILWIVLMLLFILSFIGSLGMFIGIGGEIIDILVGVLAAVSSLVVSIFMILLLLDPEVKQKMGM